MKSYKDCEDSAAAGDHENVINDCIGALATNFVFTPINWVFNGATYGLAAWAGATQGRYHGTLAAWDGGPARKPVFVGTGAALVGVGAATRIVTLILLFETNYAPLWSHVLIAQLSATSMAVGSGLFAYGLMYRKHHGTETRRREAAGLAKLRLAPQLGWNYTGLSVSGRF